MPSFSFSKKTLAGDSVRLEPVISKDEPLFAQIKKVFSESVHAERFRFEEHPVELDRLYDEEKIWPYALSINGDSVGWGMISFYRGNPFWLYSLLEPGASPDAELADEAWAELTDLLSAELFANSQFERLWFYAPQPVDPNLHELLIDLGYDPITAIDTVDTQRWGCYAFSIETMKALNAQE